MDGSEPPFSPLGVTTARSAGMPPLTRAPAPVEHRSRATKGGSMTTTSTSEEHAPIHANHALRAMPAALRESCESVRRLFTETRRAGSSARYRVGVIVQRIIDDEEKYGKSGVMQLAAAIGRGKDTLYGYAAVARRWQQADFAAVSSRRGIHGVPLTFAHFLLLAKIDLVDRRVAMVDRCLREGLSVRDLKRITAEPKRADAATHDP